MSRDKLSINTILLAAGLSRRMGGVNKLLIDIDGQTLVRKVAKLYCSISSTVTIVLGHEADRITQELADLDVTILINPDYEKGRQSTARYGLEHIDVNGDAVLIGLADQHRLSKDDLMAFVAAYQNSSHAEILIPQYEGERGNPILFPAAIAKQMQVDKKAPGCRKYIDANPDKVRWFKTQSKHFIEDLDTPEDAKRYGIPLAPQSIEIGKHDANQR